MKDLAPCPAIEYFKGQVVGRIHSLDKKLATVMGVGVLMAADVYKAFHNPADTQTPYLDEALAFSYGLQETGPGGWMGSVENIKSSEKKIPLSAQWQVVVSHNPDRQVLMLIKADDVMLRAEMNERGLEYTIADDFNPHWPTVDKALSQYVSPRHDNWVESLRSLYVELGIQKGDRLQLRE